MDVLLISWHIYMLITVLIIARLNKRDNWLKWTIKDYWEAKIKILIKSINPWLRYKRQRWSRNGYENIQVTFERGNKTRQWIEYRNGKWDSAISERRTYTFLKTFLLYVLLWNVYTYHIFLFTWHIVNAI